MSLKIKSIEWEQYQKPFKLDEEEILCLIDQALFNYKDSGVFAAAHDSTLIDDLVFQKEQAEAELKNFQDKIKEKIVNCKSKEAFDFLAELIKFKEV